jgi:hypothetical protein
MPATPQDIADCARLQAAIGSFKDCSHSPIPFDNIWDGLPFPAQLEELRHLGYTKPVKWHIDAALLLVELRKEGSL